MTAQQEQSHFQIATFCDGILRKPDNMIIYLSLNLFAVKIPEE
jgi:hypothetical protein